MLACWHATCTGHAVDHPHLVVTAEIAHLELHHEAVELRLRQRVGAFLLDGVLRRHHEERLFEAEGLLAEGHLPLLHGLEQRRLHLGRGPVDLVGQHEVAEHRPLAHRVAALAGIENLRAGDISRQHVRCELDAGEGAVEGVGKGADGEGLGEPRHALEQNVAVGQERKQQACQELVLPHEHLAHLRLHGVEAFLNGAHLGGKVGGGWRGL